MADDTMYRPLIERIAQRERQAATYRKFVMLHLETAREPAPLPEAEIDTQPLPRFDVTGEP